MANTLSLLFLLLLPGGAKAQPAFIPEETLKVICDFFTVDPLGNLFCVTREGITKYDASHAGQWHYSNPRLGPVSYLDASDPLNILVYHADFQQILWLDRNLAEKPMPETESLLRQELPEVLCSSAQGGFWIYMPQSGQLHRYSRQLHLEAQSLPFFETLPGFHDPVFMTEAAGKLYVSQPDQGIAVFDTFGNLLSVIPKTGLDRFQVVRNHLLWFSQKELEVFDFVLQEERLFLLPETRIRSGILMDRKIFVQTDHEIRVFQAADRLFQ